MFYISMKSHENIFNDFQDIEQTRFCDRRMDGQTRVSVLVICILPDGALLCSLHSMAGT